MSRSMSNVAVDGILCPRSGDNCETMTCCLMCKTWMLQGRGSGSKWRSRINRLLDKREFLRPVGPVAREGADSSLLYKQFSAS